MTPKVCLADCSIVQFSRHVLRLSVGCMPLARADEALQALEVAPGKNLDVELLNGVEPAEGERVGVAELFFERSEFRFHCGENLLDGDLVVGEDRVVVSDHP